MMSPYQAIASTIPRRVPAGRSAGSRALFGARLPAVLDELTETLVAGYLLVGRYRHSRRSRTQPVSFPRKRESRTPADHANPGLDSRLRGNDTSRRSVEGAADVARAKLFKHGRSQAVRLPKEFRLPGDEVRVSKVGDRVISY